eukprot:1236390-Amphidinium_carterae.1
MGMVCHPGALTPRSASCTLWLLRLMRVAEPGLLQEALLYHRMCSSAFASKNPMTESRAFLARRGAWFTLFPTSHK